MPDTPAAEQAALQADKNAATVDLAAENAAGETTVAAMDAQQVLRDQTVAGAQSEGTLT